MKLQFLRDYEEVLKPQRQSIISEFNKSIKDVGLPAHFNAPISPTQMSRILEKKYIN